MNHEPKTVARLMRDVLPALSAAIDAADEKLAHDPRIVAEFFELPTGSGEGEVVRHG